MKKKVILIDGNNFMFRSYYATASASLRTHTGQATNALYGFVSMINKIIIEEKPEYMVVAFDVGKNFRYEKYENYKAGRKETPEDLKSQMPLARTLLDALGIKHLELEGYEADDIIGTLAKEADLDPEYDALIISSDHDLMQLISPVVSMKLLKIKGSIHYTEKSFEEEYGFEPIKVIDLKALMGDASDNIPGVKGIGEKTAIKLLQEYKTLDGVYENIDKINGKLKDKLLQDKENAYFSYELATIYKDVPLEFDLSELTYDGPDEDKLRKIYTELEFYSLIKNIKGEPSSERLNYVNVQNLSDINSTHEYSYYIECDNENYHYAKCMGMGMYDGNNLYYITKDLIKEVINKFSLNLRYTYSLKKNMILAKKLGEEIKVQDFDAMIAYYLLENNVADDLCNKLSRDGIYCYKYDDLLKGKISEDDFKEGLLAKTKYIWDQKDNLIERLNHDNMSMLFNQIEMPLVKVLADMEITGIRVDPNVLKEMQAKLKDQINSVEQEIFKEAGEEFNVSSPKQLATVLFDTMKIPYPKKNYKTYSTDISILEKLKSYPIIPYILEYRSLTKLYSSYVEPLDKYIMEDSKIHTIYKQTLTRTGRLSSVDPNLQNIPEREKEGKLIKKAFLAEENSYLLSADYSQIELRILAHISQDETMIEAFKNDDDIHKKVASDIYGVPFDEVTKTMRSTAKQVIFGIVYGISGFGLGENLNINAKEAKEFIDKYYHKYPKVKEYMDNIKVKAYSNGYVETLFNRRRYISELNSPQYIVRSSGERIALNTPIQGTGADIIKIAMINLYNDLNKNNLKSKILLQVHDEVILNVLEDELDTVMSLVKKNMENVVSWEVPLTIGLSYGKNWYDAK